VSNTDNTTPEQTVPRGYWQDASGALIPVAKIKDIDKTRHQVVCTLAVHAQQVSELLKAFKTDAMASVAAFAEESAAQYDAKVGGKKGNVTLVSFDGRFKVVRQMQEKLAFDERLQVAKAIIDKCIHAWAKGSNKNIQALVNDAFNVDREGQVNTGRILALRRLEIDDPQWKLAMEAIADSMKTVSSKAYIRFYERNDATGEYLAIPLDVSAL